MLHIKLIKSPFGHNPRNRATVTALGLRRISHTVYHEDTPSIRGMIHQVKFLLEVKEGPAPEKKVVVRPKAAEKPKPAPKAAPVVEAKAEAVATAEPKPKAATPAKAATKPKAATPKAEAKPKAPAKPKTEPTAKATTKKAKESSK